MVECLRSIELQGFGAVRVAARELCYPIEKIPAGAHYRTSGSNLSSSDHLSWVEWWPLGRSELRSARYSADASAVGAVAHTAVTTRRQLESSW